MPHTYLACDLGAESGRVISGQVREGRLDLNEIHRFPNVPRRSAQGLHWNFLGLLCEVEKGLALAARQDPFVAGISADSWGVDYVLLDADGGFLGPVHHYRDDRTARGVERMRQLVGWPDIFAETGIQFMPINTLYQLAAEDPARLAEARGLLGVADAVNYSLCGAARAEESLASTFQLFNPRTRRWSEKLWRALGTHETLPPKVVPPGTVLGPLHAHLANETGLLDARVIATCSHDTGAAVVAVPAAGSNWAFLSSGTWSLMGVERTEPVLTDRCRELNFTNELGFAGTVRLLKNIVGLWMVQECRRAWVEAGAEMDYATLTHLAEESAPFVALINPGDPRFAEPGLMPEKVAAFCLETSQSPPASQGETVRVILESLALLYASTLEQLEELTGTNIGVLHVVGGGSQNRLLNQCTANATGREVLAGPVEATAAGNILVQAVALGELSGLDDARVIMRASANLSRFFPQEQSIWRDARKRFQDFQL